MKAPLAKAVTINRPLAEYVCACCVLPLSDALIAAHLGNWFLLLASYCHAIDIIGRQ